MARKSKLTEKQWEELKTKHLHGATIRSLSREYGLSAGTISERISEQNKKIKTVANQIVKAEQAFESLPISERIKVRSLADTLKATSRALAGAAECGAETAHRLTKLASKQTEMLNEEVPDIEQLKVVAALTKTANEAAVIPLGLVKANSGMVADANDGIEIPTIDEFEGISRKLLDEI